LLPRIKARRLRRSAFSLVCTSVLPYGDVAADLSPIEAILANLEYGVNREGFRIT
jgi:hypothetical protein